MQGDRKAIYLLLLGVLLWSTSGLLIKDSSLGAMALVGAGIVLVNVRREG